MQKIQEEEEARAAADTALENKLQTNINNLEKKHITLEPILICAATGKGISILSGSSY